MVTVCVSGGKLVGDKLNVICSIKSNHQGNLEQLLLCIITVILRFGHRHILGTILEFLYFLFCKLFQTGRAVWSSIVQRLWFSPSPQILQNALLYKYVRNDRSSEWYYFHVFLRQFRNDYALCNNMCKRNVSVLQLLHLLRLLFPTTPNLIAWHGTESRDILLVVEKKVY